MILSKKQTVMLVTSDERVPELIETVNNFTSKLNSDVPLDLYSFIYLSYVYTNSKFSLSSYIYYY